MLNEPAFHIVLAGKRPSRCEEPIENGFEVPSLAQTGIVDMGKMHGNRDELIVSED